MQWLFLFAAGLLEIGWIISLKQTEGFTKLLPMIGYACFGFSAAFCLSQALKTLPASTAYSAWVGIALVGSTFVGIVFFKEPYSIFRLVFMILIIVGVIGLKFTGTE